MLFLYALGFSYAYIDLGAGTGALILFGMVQATMIVSALIKGDKPTGFDNRIIAEKHQEFVQKGGKNVIAPIGVTSEVYTGKQNAENELAKFTAQLGGVTLGKNKKSPKKRDAVSFKKHILRYFR